MASAALASTGTHSCRHSSARVTSARVTIAQVYKARATTSFQSCVSVAVAAPTKGFFFVAVVQRHMFDALNEYARARARVKEN